MRFSESVKMKLKYDSRSRRYFGKCPFCLSGTEGFSISDEEDRYYCYICGRYGSQKEYHDSLSGTRNASEGTCNNELLSEIYEEAAAYYYRNLTGKTNPAKQYLAKRGIDDSVIDSFGLGYSPDGYDGLYNHLKDKYSDDTLLASGLIKRKDNGFVYDFFRNRAMFPIIGPGGKVTAFGARALGDELPKYVNSSENDNFSKRTILYGYPYIRKNRGKNIVICEGYMDAIAMQSNGILDSAAVLGTALTEEHAMLIGKDYSEIILCLDSDAAGIHAAKKSINMLLSFGFTVRIPDLLPAKDPDEFIRSFGINEFKNRLYRAVDAKKFLIRHSNASEIVDILKKQV